MEKQKQEQEQESFVCSVCEKEVKEEDFNQDSGWCNECVDYGDFMYDTMRNMEMEDMKINSEVKE
jgi:hypothetical protein